MPSKRLLLRDDIYATLREEILSCKLPPSTELREQQLAQRFAISKSPVREALLRLGRESLIEVVSRQGYRVTPISLSDARDMYSLRAILETACAAEVTKKASNETLASLDRHRRMPKRIATVDFIERNRDFHCALFEASGNSRMMSIGRDLIEQMDRMTFISIDTIQGRDTSALLEEHCRIIDALQARNGRLAAKLLRRHIDDAAKRMLRGLKRSAITS